MDTYASDALFVTPLGEATVTTTETADRTFTTAIRGGSYDGAYEVSADICDALELHRRMVDGIIAQHLPLDCD